VRKNSHLVKPGCEKKLTFKTEAMPREVSTHISGVSITQGSVKSEILTSPKIVKWKSISSVFKGLGTFMAGIS
jgi:hypothetical protein